MKRLPTLIVLLAGALACRGARRHPPPEVASARLFEMRASNPALQRDQAQELAAHSDRIRLLGPPPGSRRLRARLRAVRVSDEEARRWFATRPETFGGRSFETSRTTVEKMIALERVSAELGIDR